jgi:hypothetical protein
MLTLMIWFVEVLLLGVAALVSVLTLLGVPIAPATAFAVAIHGLSWLTVNIVGAICALQLIVISGLAIFQMSQRFFVGETNISLSPGHVFAYFLAAILVFYTAASSAVATIPDPRYVVPIQSLVIFCASWALSLAAAVVAHRASGSFSMALVRVMFAIKDKVSYLVGFLSAIILVLERR